MGRGWGRKGDSLDKAPPPHDFHALYCPGHTPSLHEQMFLENVLAS